MGLQGGAIIANPVPEAYQLDPEVMNRAIEAALADADRQGIKGKAITPFLLAAIEKRTGGKSLDANIELVLANARLGGEVAAEIAK